MLKIRLEPFLALTLINAGSGVLAVPFLIWTGMPGRESWGWAALSLILHIGYFFTLSEAYRRADMGQVYPLARGSAPLLTAMFSIFILGEPISVAGAAGIAVLGLGIFVMTMKPRDGDSHMDKGALLYTALTACMICGYTMSDGTGARASGNALAYAALLFVLNGIVPVGLALMLRGRDALAPMRGFLWPGIAGGAMSGASYTIAIWAMSVAPIALVAAVRETSVLFGAAIAVVFLKEPLRINRLCAAALILAGLALIRLQ